MVLGWLNQEEENLTYTSGDVCHQNSPKCILTRVLDLICEQSGDVLQYNILQYNTILTVNMALEEDIRLCRIVNEDVTEVEDESEDENDAVMTNDESHHEVTRQSLPQRLKGVSLSGRRTARFISGKTNFLITLKTPFWYHQTWF